MLIANQLSSFNRTIVPGLHRACLFRKLGRSILDWKSGRYQAFGNKSAQDCLDGKGLGVYRASHEALKRYNQLEARNEIENDEI